jgi:quinoprotein glucose dehydrogenase
MNADTMNNPGWRECLEGGDPARGKSIMFGRSDASCRRCHKVRDEGGDVGPNLTAIANEKPREYLLESIVDPNAKIAKGFETNVIVTTDGKIEVGIVRQENDASVTLMKADGETIVIAKQEIDERDPGQSGMPELVKFLSKRNLRDLVEFLSSLKQPGAARN